MDSIVNTKSKVKNKEKNKNKKFNIFVSVSLIVIYVVFLTYIVLSSIYIAINIGIYNKIKKGNEITLKPIYKYVFMCKYNIDKVKNNNIKVNVLQNGIKLELNNENLKGIMSFDVQSGYGLFEENNKLDITFSEDTNIQYINNIKVTLDTNLINSNVVDVYTQGMVEKIETLNVENGNVTINKKDDVKSYSIIYIPVKEINVSENSIKINKNSTKDLNITILPINATNTEIYVKSENEDVATMSSTGIVNAVNAGNTSILVGVENEEITKNIEVEVLPIVEDIKVSKTSVSMYVGANVTVTAKIVPENAVNGSLTWTSSDEKIAKVENGKITGIKAGKCTVSVKNAEGNVIEKKINVEVKNKPVSNSSSTSTSNGLTYVKGVLVVNKKYSVPATYNPGVNSEAYKALQKLQEAAKNAGYSMPLRSGFRSYNTQKTLYNSYVKRYGQAATDTFSAKPGHSEHQTGLAFDVGAIDDNYGNTPAGIWLAQNCHNYGFIIRYPKGKQAKTGYKYEPWHIRYLGVSTATSVYNSGLCLEEYLGI